MNSTQVPEGKLWNQHVADVLGVCLTLFVLLFALDPVIQDFSKWVAEITTPGWEEMKRRAQRAAYNDSILGGAYKWLRTYIYTKLGVELGVPLILGFGLMLLSSKDRGLSRIWNLALAATSTIVFGYWLALITLRDTALIPEATTLDFYFVAISIVLTLLINQRFFGWFIVGFAAFWIMYQFTKGYIPDFIPIFGKAYHESIYQNMVAITREFWTYPGGMFGQPIQVVTRTVLVFIVFGAILISSGAGDLLLKIANRLTGRFVGGAAHAAVTSSALFGTISGAAISNVVSTGLLTIPVIKKSGFKPSFAGATEAAASTGGQIVPPVMGVVAFFVAAEVGVAYNLILVAAILPAIFYYVGVFLTVYFEARKQGIGPLDRKFIQRFSGAEMAQSLVFIIPLTALTYFLFTQPSIRLAGLYGCGFAFVSAFVLFKRFRSFAGLYRALAMAGRMSAQIIVIVALIGLIVGLMTYSGFAGRLALFITEAATGAPLFAVLIVVAIGAIILGMGLPPGATYFIIVIALSSGIKAIGVAPLTLHLFVVFFAVMSTVTPPVALAAFVAAPIAGADPMRTGFQASRLAIAGFIIPFVFVYHPALLYKPMQLFGLIEESARLNPALVDPYSLSYAALIWIIVAFGVALWMICSALIGFEKNRLFTWERLARLAAGFCLLVPMFWISAVAMLGTIVLLIAHRFAGGEPSAIDQVKHAPI